MKDCYSSTKADGTPIKKPDVNNLNDDKDIDLQSITLNNIGLNNIESEIQNEVVLCALEFDSDFADDNNFMLLGGDESESDEIKTKQRTEKSTKMQCSLCGS